MHYVDEAFAGQPLMPADPLARSRARMITELTDEHVHISCMTPTYATASRAHLSRLAPTRGIAAKDVVAHEHRASTPRLFGAQTLLSGGERTRTEP